MKILSAFLFAALYLIVPAYAQVINPGTGGGGGAPTGPAGGSLTGTYPNPGVATLNQSTTGNAATATALASAPTKCSAGSYTLGIDVGGNAQTCTALATVATTGAYSDLTGKPTVPTIPSTSTLLYGDGAGNASGATGTSYCADLGTPAAPTVATTGTTGATHYAYTIVYVNACGASPGVQSTVLTTGNATLTASNFNTVTWATAPAGTTSIDVYQASGAAPTNNGRVAVGLSAGATSYADKGSSTMSPDKSTIPGDTSQGISAGSQALTTMLASSIGQGISSFGTGIYTAQCATQSTLCIVGTLPLAGQTDVRYTYSGTAPASGSSDSIGPVFYTTASPASSIDNHNGFYNGVAGIAFSKSTTVLQSLAGGNFLALRTSTGSGSTNPIYGVHGLAVMGDPTTSNVTGDGAVGGMFTAYPAQADMSTNNFDPFIVSGQSGVVGRVIVNNAYALSTSESVGVAGAIDVETYARNVVGGRFSTQSTGQTMARAANNYGIQVKNIAGATNLNMAIYTGSGTVQFGDDTVLAKKLVGPLTVSQLSTPVISTVSSGCNANGYACTNNGTKTYTYRVVAVYASGVTTPASATVSTAVGFDNLAAGNNANVITWAPVEGAVGGYDIYRTVAGGTTTTTTGKIANVAQNFVATYIGGSYASGLPLYIDAGAAGDSSSPPTVNNTGAISTTYTIQNGLFTVAALPTCNGTSEGTRAGATDLLTPTFLAAAVGGGAIHGSVYCDGTSWKTD